MRRRRRRRWPWVVVAGAIAAAAGLAWMTFRPVRSGLPVPGRAPGIASPEPGEEITDAEKKRLHDILERRGSDPAPPRS